MPEGEARKAGSDAIGIPQRATRSEQRAGFSERAACFGHAPSASGFFPLQSPVTCCMMDSVQAGVMELADVTDSKSVGLITRAGSTPATGTTSEQTAFTKFPASVCGLAPKTFYRYVAPPFQIGSLAEVFRFGLGWKTRNQFGSNPTRVRIPPSPQDLSGKCPEMGAFRFFLCGIILNCCL